MMNKDMKSRLSDLLRLYPLHGNEYYSLYVLHNDGWPWGWCRDANVPNLILDSYEHMADDPDAIGFLITKESGDGTVNETIFMNRFSPCNLR